MKKILIATEKPFAAVAVQGIRKIFEEAGYELLLLEKYTDAGDLLAQRDVMQPNNIVDPRSGIDWYTAAAQLWQYRQDNTPIDQIPNIPFFA